MPLPSTRVKVACKACNARRVRCDRTDGSACSNCRNAGQHCEPIDSRRGKHSKQKKDRASRPDTNSGLLSSGQTRTNQATTHQLPDPSHQSSDLLGATRNSRRSHKARQHPGPEDEENAQASGRNGVVYMGDAANINYFMGQVGDPFRSSVTSPSQGRFWGETLQQFMSEKLDQSSKQFIDQSRSNDIDHLKSLGAFQTLQKEVSDSLIQTFFEHFHPALPIFEVHDIGSLYERGRVSPLILNAIYLVAVMYCPASTLAKAGFASRYHASLFFYRMAKTFYDGNFESDVIATIQATLLMSHWWGSPLEQKDSWHWLGIAASLAQSIGMNQAKSYISLQPKHRRLWRRIWWALFIQDIHCATVLNRAPHLNASYCNIDPLNEDDFSGVEAAESIFAQPSHESALYLIYFVGLMLKVSVCLTAKLIAHGELAGSPVIDENWHLTLPQQLRDIPSPITIDHGFWGSLLQMTHCNYQIVFWRQTASESTSNTGIGTVPFNAAAKISRIIEDLLSSGALYFAPRHIISAIFAALTIHIVNTRKGDAYLKIVSEHRVRLAMLVLCKFEELWPIVIWTRRFFDCILKAVPPELTQTNNPAVQSLNQNDEANGSHLLSPDSLVNHHLGIEGDPQLNMPPNAAQAEIGASLLPQRQPNDEFSSLLASFPFGSLLEDAGFGHGLGFSYFDPTFLQPEPDISQLP